MGLMFPLISIQAVEHQLDAAGTASALMGAIQFGFGALSSAGLSATGSDSALPLAGDRPDMRHVRCRQQLSAARPMHIGP
jgi:hypothetical protein